MGIRSTDYDTGYLIVLTNNCQNAKNDIFKNGCHFFYSGIENFMNEC